VKIDAHRSGPFLFFTCACGNGQAVNATMPWCAGCGVEYDIRQGSVILRPNRKTPRFALAKALNLSGGLAMTKTDD
jgi:hypothetical protein